MGGSREELERSPEPTGRQPPGAVADLTHDGEQADHCGAGHCRGDHLAPSELVAEEVTLEGCHPQPDGRGDRSRCRSDDDVDRGGEAPGPAATDGKGDEPSASSHKRPASRSRTPVATSNGTIAAKRGSQLRADPPIGPRSNRRSAPQPGAPAGAIGKPRIPTACEPAARMPTTHGAHSAAARTVAPIPSASTRRRACLEPAEMAKTAVARRATTTIAGAKHADTATTTPRTANRRQPRKVVPRRVWSSGSGVAWTAASNGERTQGVAANATRPSQRPWAKAS